MDSHIIWNRAHSDSPVLILAHGAGAGMSSGFMETMAGLICAQGISVVRFEFPYMQTMALTGKRRPPDRQPVLLDAWQVQIEKVRKMSPVPVFIGGKSMGGRMASLLAAQWSGKQPLPGVVCLGYPFHAVGKQEKPRTAHLVDMTVPHLIIQGERDTMGPRTTVEGYTLSDALKFHWLDDGNHDLKPRKVSGFTHEQHLQAAAEHIAHFILG